MVSEGKRMKLLVVEEIENAVCHNVRLYWIRIPSEPLTQLAHYIDTVMKIDDSRSTASSPPNRPHQYWSSNYSRDRRSKQSFNVLSESKNLVRSVPDANKNEPKNTDIGTVQQHTAERALEKITRL